MIKGGIILGTGAFNCVIEQDHNGVKKVFRITMTNSEKKLEEARASLLNELEIKKIVSDPANGIPDWRNRYCFILDEPSINTTYEELKTFNRALYDDYTQCLQNSEEFFVTYDKAKNLDVYKGNILITVYEKLEPFDAYKDDLQFMYLKESILHLHRLNITHGDIHAKNILINQNGFQVFIDWDFSKNWNTYMKDVRPDARKNLMKVRIKNDFEQLEKIKMLKHEPVKNRAGKRPRSPNENDSNGADGTDGSDGADGSKGPAKNLFF